MVRSFRLLPGPNRLLATFSLLIGLAPALAATTLPTEGDVSFRLVSRDPKRNRLADDFTPEQIALLEKLNRRDGKHLARASLLRVPERWDLDELEHSPLPRDMPEGAGLPKWFLVDQRLQAFGAYESGRLVRWGPVSTGRPSRPTPPGEYHLNWRSRGRHSTVDPDWYMPWYFNFQNRRGFSLHQYELPGIPASHACIRLLERDARWLYEWGEEWQLDDRQQVILRPGTPMRIVGEYDFSSPPPWLVADPAPAPAEPVAAP